MVKSYRPARALYVKVGRARVKVAGRPGPLPPPSVPGRSTSDTRLTLLYMHVTDDP